MPSRKSALLFAALLLTAGAASAALPALKVAGGWSRPAVAGSNGVGYLTILNGGSEADSLVRVESPVAARVEMHRMAMAGSVMSMSGLDRLPVPAHGKAGFAPGGDHLMFVGLKRALKMGDKVPATLTFASGARLQAVFSVGVMPPAM